MSEPRLPGLTVDLVELRKRLSSAVTLERLEKIEEHLRAILTSPELAPEQRARVEEFLQEALQEKAITSQKINLEDPRR
jgi:hypothetical protein